MSDSLSTYKNRKFIWLGISVIAVILIAIIKDFAYKSFQIHHMASFAIELTHSISVIIAFCSIFNVLFGKKVFFAILKKELNHFLGSYIGYFAIIGFLILNGFFLWMNTGNNILDYGIAELDLLFETAPLIMLLLIPAITMRSLAEEYSNGTIEFLLTKPISKAQILLGKFLACLSIIALAILPTLVYVFTIYELGSPIGNLDTGATISSYIGLICLGAAFAAIGIFASAVSKNQIIAFILGIFVCYFTYRGFDDISRLPLFFGKSDDIIQSMGLSHHFMAIRKGVLDTRDLIYFISFTALFLTLSNKIISWRK